MLALDLSAILPGVPDPFPGLRPFQSAEETIFRGRQSQTAELLRRLASHRLLAVVGTSGSGKSSLVRAGLLPALHRAYLVGATSRWRVAIMRPGMAPIDNLLDALRHPDALGGADANRLRSSSLGLVETVRAAGLREGESLLVVVDQFEELFRHQHRMMAVDGGMEAAQLVQLLLTAAKRPDAPVYVVLTMRSDFLGDCSQFSGLPEALSESQYLIPRLTREERRQAIEEPLRLFGTAITPQLVEQLLNDSAAEAEETADESTYRGSAPDPLPVLQHALMRTYGYWKALPPEQAGERLDLHHYQQVGRMASALDKHAETLFTHVLDDRDRMWTERIFRCLTTTELGRAIRRPTPLSELYAIVGAQSHERAEVDNVLSIYRHRDNSFLHLSSENTVDISHESLIWKWKRLAEWVKVEASSSEVYRDLVKDATGRATWGEPKLSFALTLKQKEAWNAAWARQYSASDFEQAAAFLQRSRRAVRNHRLLRWGAVAASVAIVVLALWASNKAKELTSVKQVRDRLAADLEKRAKEQQLLKDQIGMLDAKASKAETTQSERDAIAREREDLLGQLQRSQHDAVRLNSEVEKTTTLQESISTLQSHLTQAQTDLASQTAARKDLEARLAAETKARETADASVSQLTRDLERTRAPRGTEAAAAIVAAYRQLARDDAYNYRAQLAVALHVSGTLYASMQRVKEAEAAFAEALAIQRLLAKTAPATYLPAVASTLHSLGTLQWRTKQLKEAETNLAEALAIRRQFADNSRATYLIEAGTTLNYIGNVYGDQGRGAEAIAAYNEAISIRRTFAGDNPAATRSGLASSLMNIALRYLADGRYVEAESAFSESIALSRELMNEDNESLPRLALSLNNLSILYQRLGRSADREAALNESLTIYRQLAKNKSIAEIPNMLLTLTSLALMYRDTKRLKEAEAAYAEAIELGRELAKTNPLGHGDRLSNALIGFAELLQSNGAAGSRPCALATEAAQVAVSQGNKQNANTSRQKLCPSPAG